MTGVATEKDVHTLIMNLDNSDIAVRQQARQALTAIGKPAVDQLINALSDPRAQTRWQAALILGEIGDGAAVPDLIKTLEDDSVEVRWRAAESLGALGYSSLEPLLKMLVQHPERRWLRDGTHHALRLLAVNTDGGNLIKPVLKALDDIEPTMTVPIAAALALQQLHQKM